MGTLIIKTNIYQTTDVLIRDMGIVIPGSGGSETLTDVGNINDARMSTDLHALATDDAYGAGSSTLILNNGSSDIPQDEIDYWLAVLSGLLGPTGTQGETGPSGVGETGLQGVTGTADVLRGSIPFPSPPKDREFYWYEDEQTLFMYEGVTAMAWIDISSGSKLGVTGAQGVTGASSVRYETRCAYVSAEDGNDDTAELENPAKPYKTIQVALDDIKSQVPSDENRWIVYIDQGYYPENIVMIDWVVLRGPAGTNAIIQGTVTFDNQVNYQSEIELMGIETENAPCAIVNAGSDDAYIGFRTCWLISTYNNDSVVKTSFELTRGNAFLYGSTEVDLYVTSNNTGTKYESVFYIHGDEVAWLENVGTISYLTSSDADDTCGFVASFNTNPLTKSTWTNGYGYMILEDAHAANIAGISSQISGSGIIDFKNFIAYNDFTPENTIKYVIANSSGNIDSNAITRFSSCDVLFLQNHPYEFYIGQAAGTYDTIRLWHTYLHTKTDEMPPRYSVSGYSGVIEYDIINPYGTTLKSGNLISNEHGFFEKFIRVGGMCGVHTPTGGEIRYQDGDIEGYVDGQWKSLTQSSNTGIEGQTGAQGITGFQGATGAQGATGIQGNTGSQGTTGVLGNTGSQGVTGVQGNTGSQGTTGVQGNTGSQGTTGVLGNTGSQGVTGLRGTTGIQGVTGIQGNTGSQGVTGIQGNTGSQGVTGLRGTTGIQGVTGIQGNTGVQGYTGLQGSTGLSGYRTFHFFADQMDIPASADWPVTGIAPAAADTLNSALVVRRYDDTVEEGAGFILEIPDNVSNMILDFRSRPQSAPTGAQRSVTPRIYARCVCPTAGIVGWTGVSLNAITFETGITRFRYDSRTVSITSLGLTGGVVSQFELTRIAGSSGLPGDWALLETKVTFT